MHNFRKNNNRIRRIAGKQNKEELLHKKTHETHELILFFLTY